MNSFYSKEELHELGFQSIGDNVINSKKASLYAIDTISIAYHLRIDDFCIISGNLMIGNNIHIAAYSTIYGAFGVEMEDFTGLSPRCTIFSAMDDFSGDFLISPTTKKEYNHIIKGNDLIKKYSQLGVETFVFPSITIEEGCSTGSKILVTKSTEPWCIYIGKLARRLKERNKDLLNFINEY